MRKRDKGQFDSPITRATRTGPTFSFRFGHAPFAGRSARACDHLSTRFFFSRERVVGPRMRKRPKRSGPLLALPACHFALAHRPRSRIERDDINLDLLLLYSSCIPHKSPLSPCNPSSLSSHLLYLDLPFQTQSSIREYPKEGDDPFASSSPPINSIKTLSVALSPSSPYRSFPADPDFFPFPLVLQFASRTFITLVTSSNHSFSLVLHLGTP